MQNRPAFLKDKIYEHTDFGLVVASFWFRLRFPKGGRLLCLFWHLAT